MNTTQIKEYSTWDLAIEAHNSIAEFDKWDATNFAEILTEETKPQLILVSTNEEDKPIAYLIAYDRWKDESFYIWMTGVNQSYRGQHLFSRMLQYASEWSRAKGYKSLKLKTRNNRREMLSFLVKDGWNFLELTPYPNVEDNRLLAIKSLENKKV
jgi:ribosomal protein S18 acetylase RimI-like enzyme